MLHAKSLGPRLSPQPIRMLAEPAATSAARLPAVARIRTSLPFIFSRPPTWVWVHRALLLRGTDPLRLVSGDDWADRFAGVPRLLPALTGNSLDVNTSSP